MRAVAPAYRLHISPEHERALEAFPERVRNELKLRIDNVTVFPVSELAGDSHETRVAVDGYSATLKLDARARIVTVVDVSGP